MANKCLHIAFHWNGPAKPDEAARLIERPEVAEDWFKYGGNCWIVYTPHNQTAWSTYLKEALGQYDSVIICEITNLNHTNGWLPANFWPWFNQYRP